VTTLRVALFGEYGLGNLGNDMTCRAAVDRLGALLPDSTFTALTSETGRTQELVGLESSSFATPHGSSFPARVWAKFADLAALLRLIGKVDVVVVPGTGMLEDPTARMPGGQLTWLALLSLACRLHRVPLVWVGMGGSPYASWFTGRVAAWAARGAARRSYRDDMTRDALGKSRLDVSDDQVIYDLVLAVDPLPQLPAPSGGHVAVSVFDLPPEQGRTRYTKVLAQVVDRLTADGNQVTMVVMDDEDVPITNDVLALLDGPAPPTVQPTTLDDLLAVLAPCDVVVGTRYHTLVGTLVARRSPVALSHAAKDVALLAQAGLDDYVLDVTTVDADEVLAAVAFARTETDRARQAGDQVCAAARTSVGAETAAIAAVLERLRP